MRMLMKITLPHAKFNAAMKEGKAGEKMRHILEELKPEAAYFTEFNGHRSAIIIIDLPDASRIPALAEPWFLEFEADVEVHPVMTVEDLAKSSLDMVAKKWG